MCLTEQLLNGVVRTVVNHEDDAGAMGKVERNDLLDSVGAAAGPEHHVEVNRAARVGGNERAVADGTDGFDGTTIATVIATTTAICARPPLMCNVGARGSRRFFWRDADGASATITITITITTSCNSFTTAGLGS